MAKQLNKTKLIRQRRIYGRMIFPIIHGKLILKQLMSTLLQTIIFELKRIFSLLTKSSLTVIFAQGCMRSDMEKGLIS